MTTLAIKKILLKELRSNMAWILSSFALLLDITPKKRGRRVDAHSILEWLHAGFSKQKGALLTLNEKFIQWQEQLLIHKFEYFKRLGRNPIHAKCDPRIITLEKSEHAEIYPNKDDITIPGVLQPKEMASERSMYLNLRYETWPYGRVMIDELQQSFDLPDKPIFKTIDRKVVADETESNALHKVSLFSIIKTAFIYLCCLASEVLVFQNYFEKVLQLGTVKAWISSATILGISLFLSYTVHKTIGKSMRSKMLEKPKDNPFLKSLMAFLTVLLLYSVGMVYLHHIETKQLITQILTDTSMTPERVEEMTRQIYTVPDYITTARFISIALLTMLMISISAVLNSLLEEKMAIYRLHKKVEDLEEKIASAPGKAEEIYSGMEQALLVRGKIYFKLGQISQVEQMIANGNGRT